jgi:Na+/glutamate symporter
MKEFRRAILRAGINVLCMWVLAASFLALGRDLTALVWACWTSGLILIATAIALSAIATPWKGDAHNEHTGPDAKAP